MKKNPEHKKFMADYDGLTDDKMKRVSGVDNPDAMNKRPWYNKRITKKEARNLMDKTPNVGGGRRTELEEKYIDAVGASVTIRDWDKKRDEQTPIAADKIEKPISLEEAWEKSKSRGKKSK